MTCMCGDLYCHSCGPAQGNYRCEACGTWSADGECENPLVCREALLRKDKEYALWMEEDRKIEEYLRKERLEERKRSSL